MHIIYYILCIIFFPKRLKNFSRISSIFSWYDHWYDDSNKAIFRHFSNKSTLFLEFIFNCTCYYCIRIFYWPIALRSFRKAYFAAQETSTNLSNCIPLCFLIDHYIHEYVEFYIILTNHIFSTFFTTVPPLMTYSKSLF